MSEEEIAKEIKQMTLNAGDSWADTVEAPVTTTSLLDEELDKQQHDPTNPLYSQQIKFENMKLKPELLKGIYSMHFKEPSSIQAKSLPIILEEDVNLIAQSQSGTGKTACFGLAMLQAVDESVNSTQAICICPALELATQIYSVVKGLGQHTGIKIYAALKGQEIPRNLTDHIVIGTPGTVNEMIRRRSINTKTVKILAVDEADQMLEEGNSQLRDQTILIKKGLPEKCRVLLFSATFKEEDDDKEGAEKEKKVLDFAEKVVPQPLKTILIPKEKLTLKHMKQFVVKCVDETQKIQVIKDIYETLKVGQSIIFVNSKNYAEKLANVLQENKFTVSVTHGGLDPEVRKKVMSEFVAGTAKVLITTNVLARGVDIATVTHVINFDLPVVYDEKTPGSDREPDYATYLHRVGRTARFGKKGYAINICRDREYRIIEAFRKNLQAEIKDVPPEDLDEHIK
ncbi:predicted protein [Naegleria gruberi]|uniref:RNA helicase n=1 Tax=Naegleria gruberi TaxID=5762 RepID=D2UY94_NAEGR|nr:uncharacterized protein NAEGRDRAFT_77772 [Naegleria gruberi]EFC50432.1 predicted protein [Naegleria gruberi]|eukprot:XP_002683176.1 predicted protein [Naegleria gruberi strain NEG-M]